MQVTGWGVTEALIFDKKHFRLKPKCPNQLKVAYVEDYTQKGDTGPMCDQNEPEKICVFNGTLALNSDFSNSFVIWTGSNSSLEPGQHFCTANPPKNATTTR